MLKGVLQNCWGEFLNILGSVMQKYWEMMLKKWCKLFYKTTEICPTKIIKGVLQNYWYVVCKNTRSNPRRCSIKKAFLKNFAIFIGKHPCWSLFNNVAGLEAWHLGTAASEMLRGGCSEKILKVVLQNCWGKFHTPTENKHLPCKNLRTWSDSRYIIAFYFRRPEDNKHLMRIKSFANFSYSLKLGKGDTGDRSYDF